MERVVVLVALCGALSWGWGCSADQAPVVEAPQGQAAAPGAVLTPAQAAAQHPGFGSYWYQGKAELSRYALSQARYSENHEGEAVLIFVTEDFLKDKQVKYEFGPRDNATPILKLNAYRRFYTGIYPYTMLTSVFQPTAAGAATLKISSNTQEWCGAAFAQLNRRDAEWQVTSLSYFQAEGDQRFSFAEAADEDGVWVQLRKDPRALPTGELQMVPALHYLRLMHKPTRAYAATARVEDAPKPPAGGGPAKVWRVSYPELDRELAIYYSETFPYQILGWEESHPSFGGQKLTTRAALTHALLDDYWSHHNNKDAPLREALGLEF